MTLYCSVCGDELEPEEEEDGMCESCKLSKADHTSDEAEPEVS